MHSIYSLHLFKATLQATGDHPIQSQAASGVRLHGSCRKMLSTRLTGSSSHLNQRMQRSDVFMVEGHHDIDISMSEFEELKENRVLGSIYDQ